MVRYYVIRRRPHSGEGAWIGLAAYIVAYDWYALKTGRKTLSETFHEISRTRFGPLVLAFWVYLSLHLVRFLPEAADVFRMGGGKYRHAKAKYQQVS